MRLEIRKMFCTLWVEVSWFWFQFEASCLDKILVWYMLVWSYTRRIGVLSPHFGPIFLYVCYEISSALWRFPFSKWLIHYCLATLVLQIIRVPVVLFRLFLICEPILPRTNDFGFLLVFTFFLRKVWLPDTLVFSTCTTRLIVCGVEWQQCMEIKSHTKLEVEAYYGAKGADDWNAETWQNQIIEHAVSKFVVTWFIYFTSILDYEGRECVCLTRA